MMRKLNVLIILVVLFFSSCQSKLEKFNNDYDSFKKESKENLDITFKNFMSIENANLEQSLTNKILKDIKLDLTESSFNAILIDKSIFDYINEKPKTLNLFNPISGNNIIFIKRMLNNDEHRMYFLESIRKKDFEFDELSGPMMQFNEFISFSKKFPQIKYILINYPSHIELPSLTTDGFYKGEYNGTIALFDFKTKKMLSSFDFYATSSDAVYESNTVQGDNRTLYNDFNEQIEKSIKEKLEKYYTISSYDLEGLELVKYIE